MAAFREEAAISLRTRLVAALAAVLALPAFTASGAPALARSLTMLPQTGPLPATCATPARWRLMFAGDSMTAGTAPGLPQYRPYWSWLGARMWSVQWESVGSQRNTWGVHEGISGQSASQLYTRIDGLLDTYDPDVVILDIGTNLDGTQENTWGWVQRVADKILARPCVRLLLAQVSMHYDAPRSIAQRYLNEQIPGYIQSRDGTGTRARWVNFANMTYSMTVDKLHWSDRGADVASIIAFDQLCRFIPMPASAIDLPFMPEQTGGPE